MIGQTISHYEITEELGRGGMGVVYKATDTELNRTVALKFLPTHVISSDRDRERFRREAQAAAALSHPNIATVYAIEESDDQSFIAMEYVDGQTLQEIIAESPMKIDRAIEVATQIARGLEAAHEQGVVHRDIKPSNIMFTSRGHVKIMDFGLAKISAASLLTQTGSTLGTAGYMSPEQARGDEVDRRSDVWGLGVVLYEMITGRLPFGGEYEQALVYSILNAEPEPLTALRTGVPIALDGVIAKALAKDPDMRYQHVDEIPADLKAVQSGTSSMTSRITPVMSGVQHVSAVEAQLPSIQAQAAPPKRSNITLIPWVLASIATAAALFFALFTGSSDVVEPVRRITIPLDPAVGGFNQESISISADGRAFSFKTLGPDSPRFFVRFFDEELSRLIFQSNWRLNPSLSPDARWLAYKQGRSLYRVSTGGGNPELLSDSLGGDGFSTWQSPTEIVTSGRYPGRPIEFFVIQDANFTAFPSNSSITVPANNTIIDIVDLTHIHHAPDSDVIFYTQFGDTRSSISASIMARELSSGREAVVARGATSGRYFNDGYVLFQRSGDLHAIPFDLKTFETGSSFPILTDVATVNDGRLVLYDVAQNGTLIYIPAEVFGDRQGASLVVGSSLVELNAAGGRTGALNDPRFSPDGSKILVLSRDEQTDIWLIDRTLEGATQRLTDNSSEDETPFWHPDGVHFFYKSVFDGRNNVLRSNVNNISDRDTLFSAVSHIHVESVSQDGQFVFITARSNEALDDIWVVSAKEPYEARELINTAFNEFAGRISPDGKSLAYVSDETGRAEIYLQNFPELNQRTILTTEGGISPVWSRDGRSLYFVSGKRLMRKHFENGRPVLTEEVGDIPSHLLETGNHTQYDVLGNGEEFLFIDTGAQVGDQAMEMHAITGLSELLRQRDPERN